ncbi:hypothetical protein MFUR16E_21625 [Methylobacterium fujisawaense]|uniref:recombinase family protein n=1 Tax=Methylobacterium fujisawaense TaxID=107400 RepID=UPI002F335BF0
MRDETGDRGRSEDLLKDLFDQHDKFRESPTAAPPTQRVAVYCRRSRADERDVSIGRQVAICIDYCSRIGAQYDPALLFIDRNCSGSTLEGRTSFNALLQHARAGLITKVIAEGLDRVTRDVVDSIRIRKTFDDNDIELHVADFGPIGLEEMTIRALLAQKERERINGLMLAGQRAAAAEGRSIGKRRHYGYDNNPADGTWTINRGEAEVLLDTFQSIDENGTSTYVEANRLNAAGVPTAGGKQWSARRLFNQYGHGVLQNRLLVGEHVRFRNSAEPIVVQLPYLAIIDRDLFDRVNEKCRPRPVAKRSAQIEPERELLTHIASCGQCGMPISKKKYEYGDWTICCSRAGPYGTCDERTFYKSRFVERQMLITMAEEILHPDRLEFWKAIRYREWEALHRRIEPRRTAILERMQEIEFRTDSILEPAETMRMIDRACLADAELEHHKLGLALKTLDLPPLLEIDEIEAAELRSGIAALLLRLPVLAETDEDRRLVLRLRTIVPRVAISRSTSCDGYRVSCLVGIADGREPGSNGAIDCPDRWLANEVERLPGHLQIPEVVTAHHRAAAEGAFRFSDADWESISHLFEPFREKSDEQRRLAEALVMMASTGLYATMLPEPYAFAKRCLWLVRRAQVWALMFDILARRGSSRIDGLRRNQFDPRPHPTPWLIKKRA